MTTAVAEYVDILRSLHNSKQRLLRLVRDHDELRAGVGLFAYHGVPKILQGMSKAGMVVSGYSAQIELEQHWNLLGDEEQKFWARQAYQLCTGDLTSLDEHIYDNFRDNTQEQDGRNVRREDSYEDKQGWSPQPVNGAGGGFVPLMTGKTEAAYAAANRPAAVPNASNGSQGAMVSGLACVNEQAGHQEKWSLVKRSTQQNQKMHKQNPQHSSSNNSDCHFASVPVDDEIKMVLLILGGEQALLPNSNFCALIPTILYSIKRRIEGVPNSCLCGRSGGIRVNFDPDSDGITSIKARLLSAAQRGSWVDLDHKSIWSVQASVGHMLRAMVQWNQHTSAFPELQRISASTRRASEDEYRSCFAWLESHMSEIGPISFNRRSAVVAMMMHLLRARAKVLCPDPDLIKNSPVGWITMPNGESQRAEQSRPGYFGLVKNDVGFGKQLLACFEREKLADEEYRDLIEQRMFRLQRKYPKLDLTRP